jgi:DNA-binding PadR family transcriptional regulator
MGTADQTGSRLTYYAGRYNVSRYMKPTTSDGSRDPELLILASLGGGPRHGYGMIEDIQTSAGVRLGPGTLYGAITRLEQRGLIQAVESADRRRPYRLTATGAAQLQREVEALERVVLFARRSVANE